MQRLLACALLLALSGCSDASHPAGSSSTVAAAPPTLTAAPSATPSVTSTASSAATPPPSLRVQQVNTTLGLSGVHAQGGGTYESIPILGGGFSANCILATAPQAVGGLHVHATWTPQPASPGLRFIVILPQKSVWVWDNTTMAGVLDADVPVRLLQGQAEVGVLVELPAGSTSATADQAVAVTVTVEWDGEGTLGSQPAGCTAAE